MSLRVLPSAIRWLASMTPRNNMNRNPLAPKSVRRQRVRVAMVMAALCLVFFYAVGVVLYHWPPFSILKAARDVLYDSIALRSPNDYRGQDELIRFAFTDPLIQGEQIHDPISTLDGIYEGPIQLNR